MNCSFLLLRLTMFSLPSLLHIHKNYLHAGIQECDMMISPTSLIKHCKIRDYAGPPRVTFQGYHIMFICWVSSSSGPLSTSGLLFYGDGWWKAWYAKSLNSYGNLLLNVHAKMSTGDTSIFFSLPRRGRCTRSYRRESQTWCEEWYDTFVRFRFLLPPETRVPFP